MDDHHTCIGLTGRIETVAHFKSTRQADLHACRSASRVVHQILHRHEAGQRHCPIRECVTYQAAFSKLRHRAIHFKALRTDGPQDHPASLERFVLEMSRVETLPPSSPSSKLSRIPFFFRHMAGWKRRVYVPCPVKPVTHCRQPLPLDATLSDKAIGKRIETRME